MELSTYISYLHFRPGMDPPTACAHRIPRPQATSQQFLVRKSAVLSSHPKISLTAADNYTYSIDLSTLWTNSSVTLKEISKGAAPVLNNVALWLDASGEIFYAYE